MEQEKKQPDVRLIGLDLDGTTLTSDKGVNSTYKGST